MSVAAGNYATFTRGNLNQFCSPCIPPSTTLPYTPTTAILTAANYPRVIGRDDNPYIEVEFSQSVSRILVFNNVDHVGLAWDAYQYDIYGSNDDTSFTLLFNPLSVNEPNNSLNIATAFTLLHWQGTGPTLVNNTLTPGNGGFNGTIGYEEYFDFGASSFKFYAFRQSTLATNTAFEIEQELSAVAEAAAPVPEPASLTLLCAAICGIVLGRRRHSG